MNRTPSEVLGRDVGSGPLKSRNRRLTIVLWLLHVLQFHKS
jgi:hypothetical protein